MLGKVVQLNMFGGEDVVAEVKSKKSRSRKEPELARRSMVVEVYAGGPRATVDGEVGGLSCNYCKKPGCSHIRLAEDVLFGDGKGYGGVRFISKSGFHKELRRGDLGMARAWAHWFSRFWGQAAPLGYLRKIWSEETCSLALMRALDGDIELEDAILLFVRTPKMWEFPVALEVWSELYAGRVEYDEGEMDVDWGNLEEDAIVEYAMASPHACGSALVEAWHRDQKGQHVGMRVRLSLVQKAVDAGVLDDGEDAESFRRRYRSGRFENEDVLLWMLLTGRYDEKMDAARDVVEPAGWRDERYLPYPRAYVNDYHTHRGKRALKEWQERTGRTLAIGADMGELDYRWAGGVVPMVWRFLAWEQHGRLDVPWTTVRLTEAVACRFEDLPGTLALVES
jgi:hypothetical protein